MKALTLTQPWASLVALDCKRMETRDWQTSYRGLLAIHAAKSYPEWVQRLLLFDEDFRDAIRRSGFTPADFTSLPLGAVVAVVRLVDCVRITRDNAPSAPEHAFGDYTPGRFMWRLRDTRRLPEPITARGYQQLWDWTPPPGLLEAMGVQA